MNESVPPEIAEEFLETQEYRRFAEFCDACRQYRYIGLCHGPPGVGKTLSAQHYARWQELEAVFKRPQFWMDTPSVPELAECRTVVYTPSMMTTPKRLDNELGHLQTLLHLTVEAATHPDPHDDWIPARFDDRWTELLIVDEADRLKFPTLEQLRDVYDRGRFGLVLIGMPGLEKRLSRYGQFYSRVGFVHQYRPLSADAMHAVLAQKWEQRGIPLDPNKLTDAEALAAVMRITTGNFRLVDRLFSQIERVLEINGLHEITPDVVEAARHSLVIGST
jgi:DNA transposition AAA+ family ATPase